MYIGAEITGYLNFYGALKNCIIFYDPLLVFWALFLLLCPCKFGTEFRKVIALWSTKQTKFARKRILFKNVC